MKIAVVIPTYNERKNIAKVIKEIIEFVPKAAVVVVDDNSPDGTGGEVLKLRRKNKNVFLIKRERKQGRGGAVFAGLKFAYERLRAEMAVEMDADFSHRPQELPGIIKLTAPKTVILASRYVKGGKTLNWPILRRLISYLSNAFIRLILGLPVRDNTNGFRSYPRAALEVLLHHKFKNSGYVRLSESAYVLSKNGFKLKEIPSTFPNRRRGQSNTDFKELADSFWGVLKIRFSS